MTEKQLSGVRARLERFLSDLVEPMGRSERRQWAQIYVQGLLLDGQRKSVQPMAERIAGADEQGLNQFLNQSPCKYRRFSAVWPDDWPTMERSRFIGCWTRLRFRKQVSIRSAWRGNTAGRSERSPTARWP